MHNNSKTVVLFMFAFLFFMFLTGAAFAQSGLLPAKFNAEIRARSEASGRDFDNSTGLNTYTLLRTRFGALILPLEDVQIFMQFQDSQVFGTKPKALSGASNIDLHQAYFEIANIWNKSIFLKIGRQELTYGNERLIGSEGFGNVGRALEGIKLTFGKNRNIDIFTMLISESTPPGTMPGTPNADFNFLGFYYKHRRNLLHVVDGYLFFESNLEETSGGENELKRVTIGTYDKGKIGRHIDFETELAYQFGKRRGRSVSAFMLTGSLGYHFGGGRKPHLSIGLDYLSGTTSADADYKAFDTLYATNHKFYGFMDYFLKLPIDSQSRGLQDAMLKLKIPLGRKVRFDAHYHNFRMVRGERRSLGNEFDFVLSYVYNVVASFQVAMTFFVPDDPMLATSTAGDIGFWSYTTFLVKF